MRDPIGRSIDLRLYLEGIRVPIRSISVAGSQNNHLNANIEIPPTPLSTSIKARTLVHVFYKTSTDSSLKLLFEGEVVGIAASEDTKSKSTTLICTDLTNFWDFIWLYFLNKVSPERFAGVDTAAFASGDAPDGGKAFTGFSYAVPEELSGSLVLSAFIQAGSDVQRALLNIIFLMANTGGATVGDLNNPRLNSFLERAFVNLRLGERIFVLPDQDIKKLIDLRVAQSVLNKSVGDLGNFASLTELVNRFLGFVYYSWIALPAPPFTARNTKSSESTLDFYNPVGTGTSSASSLKATTSAAVDNRPGILKDDKILRSVVFKPQSYFLPPPTCNFLFPGMFDNFSSTRMFLHEPTRLRMQSHPIPGNVSNINEWNTASFYAPSELGEIIRKTEKAGGLQPDSSQGQGNVFDGTVTPNLSGGATSPETDPSPDKPAKLRFETLITQTGSGEIDETITGVVPAFEELGWAEYATLGIDSPLNKNAENTAEEGTPFNAESRVVIETQEGTATREISDKTAQVYLTQIAQYKLDLRRFAPRTLEAIRGPYNPNLVLGFPGIVFTKRGIFTGEIDSINHICGAGGQAYTTITLGMARELSMIPGIFRANTAELNILERVIKDFAERTKDSEAKDITPERFKTRVETAYNIASTSSPTQGGRPEEASLTSVVRLRELIAGFDPLDRSADQPEWLNDLYAPANIGTKVYQKLFGTNVKSLVDDIAGTNMILAANLVLITYLKKQNKVQHALDLTKRDIATASEIMKDYLGAARAPKEKRYDREKAFEPDDLAIGIVADESFSPFNASRTTAVRNYMTHIVGARGKGFRG